MAKRIVDILLSLAGLIVLAPLLVVISVLVRLGSPGPVFFRQTRVGLNGRNFRILKFRTMVLNADKMGSRLTQKRDPRVTRVGQILRWLKLDELPQLVNVLVGDMSLIGPRPEDEHFVSYYSTEQRRVLSVRPGILGPSQIAGRDELEEYPDGLKDTESYYIQHILPGKLARDLEYVRTCSFQGDMRLLAHGLWVVARGTIKGKFLWRWRWRITLFGLDCALVAASFVLSYFLRADFVLPDNPNFVAVPTALIVVVRGMLLAYSGAYQGLFAYFGMSDVVGLFRAVAASAIITAGLTFFIGFQSFPRSVFVIDGGIALLILGGLRFGLRSWVRWRASERGRLRHKAIVVGAGIGGEQVARTLLEDPLSAYRPVGFIDEVQERWGARIHGVRVLGGPSELPLALSAREIRAVFVCMSDVSEAAAREVVEMCDKAGTDYRIVPNLSDLLGAGHAGSNGRANGNGNGSRSPVSISH